MSEKLSEYEESLSNLYQLSKESPSSSPDKALDNAILAMAKKHQLNSDSGPVNQGKKTKRNSLLKWQWPLSIAASVCIVSLVFITQRPYFNGSEFVEPQGVLAEEEFNLKRPVSSPTATSADVFDPATSSLNETRPRSQKIRQAAVKSQTEAEFFKAKRSALTSELASKQEAFQAQRLRSPIAEEKLSITADTAVPIPRVAERKKELLELPPEVLRLANKLRAGLNGDNQSSALALVNDQAQLQNELYQALLLFKKKHPGFVLDDKYLSLLNPKQKQAVSEINEK